MKDIGNVIFGIVIALCLIGLVVCTIYLNSGDQRMLDNFCQSKGYDEMTDWKYYQTERVWKVECDKSSVLIAERYCVSWDKWGDCSKYDVEVAKSVSWGNENEKR